MLSSTIDCGIVVHTGFHTIDVAILSTIRRN